MTNIISCCNETEGTVVGFAVEQVVQYHMRSGGPLIIDFVDGNQLTFTDPVEKRHVCDVLKIETPEGWEF